jgi:hypothetical protein
MSSVAAKDAALASNQAALEARVLEAEARFAEIEREKKAMEERARLLEEQAIAERLARERADQAERALRRTPATVSVVRVLCGMHVPPGCLRKRFVDRQSSPGPATSSTPSSPASSLGGTLAPFAQVWSISVPKVG